MIALGVMALNDKQRERIRHLEALIEGWMVEAKDLFPEEQC
jgi:hypothetical protein